MNQKIKPINDEQRAWIEVRLDRVRAFVDTHSPGDAGQPVGVDGLDRALAAWVDSGETDPEQIAAAVDVLAVAFGRFLERSLDFTWVTVTSPQGSELALHGLPGRGDVLIFPQDLIGKRCQKRQKKFMKATLTQISQHVGLLGRASRESAEQ